MLEIKSRIKARRGAYRVATKGALRLSFEQRRTSGLRTTLASGEEVALLLPRGEVLRGGDLVVASDGRVIEVQAAAERLIHVECDSAAALARCAYHLGSRRVPVEVGTGHLRVAADPALEDMLKALGARLEPMDAPFEPEMAALADIHSHQDEPRHAGHDHDHDHGHGHDHAHDHAHCDHPHHHHHHK